MNRIFFRFFVLVMLSITAATFVVYFTLSRLFGDPLEDIARRQAAAQIFLLEQYVDQAPADAWLTRLNRVREVSDTRYTLVPLAQARAALGPAGKAALMRGEVVLDVAGKSFLRRVDLQGERYVGSADEALQAENLPIDIGLALKMEVVRYLIVALMLLVPIALWSRAHWRSLQTLAGVADAFGAGQLKARAHLPASASIYPLAARIDHMADRIEDLLVAQTNLLHSVSHELRTPIARLEFALALLAAHSDDGAQARRITAMEGDLAELNQLIKELLGMASLDATQALQREPVALAALCASVVAALPPADIAVQMAIERGVGVILADPRLLGRALSNLLCNAQKYARATIQLRVQRSQQQVQISVEDDGPGIALQERERVFAPFYRLDRSRDRATGGFGLGLSIARKALLLHGGNLVVHESALGGACFVMTLPDAPPACTDDACALVAETA